MTAYTTYQMQSNIKAPSIRLTGSSMAVTITGIKLLTNSNNTLDLQINSLLFLTIHIGIIIKPLYCSNKLLRLSSCTPLTSSFREYLFGIKHQQKIKNIVAQIKSTDTFVQLAREVEGKKGGMEKWREGEQIFCLVRGWMERRRDPLSSKTIPSLMKGLVER